MPKVRFGDLQPATPRLRPLWGKTAASLMFNPVVRKNIEEMIEQDKKREAWGSKFPATTPAVRVLLAEFVNAMEQ